MRILFTVLLILSLTFPLFQVKSDRPTDRLIDFAKEKILDGNWGMITNELIEVTEKLIKEDKETEEGLISKTKNTVITGYGVGFSSIGAAVVSWNNYRFKTFEIVPILPLFIIFTVLLQILFHGYLYRSRNAILSVLNMLLAVSIFGNCIGNENYSGYLNGVILFMIIQVSYMIYFYWFPYKKVINENDGIQSS